MSFNEKKKDWYNSTFFDLTCFQLDGVIRVRYSNSNIVYVYSVLEFFCTSVRFIRKKKYISFCSTTIKENQFFFKKKPHFDE